MTDVTKTKKLSGAIFDLDGVIVDTARYHYIAWLETARKLGFGFTEKDNERLKGVSRSRSLEILLEIGGLAVSDDEKEALCEQKNTRYVEMLGALTKNDILPGASELLLELRNRGVKTALGSASKNAPYIIDKLTIAGLFDAIADGNSVSMAKPNPEIFLAAARMIGLQPLQCAVFEDASAGIEAAIRGGMYPVGVGEKRVLKDASLIVSDLTDNKNILQLFI